MNNLNLKTIPGTIVPLLFFLALISVACNFEPPASVRQSAPSPTLTPPSPAPPPVKLNATEETQAATATPLLPTPTPAIPSPTPAAPAIPTPEVNWDDLSPYRQAMRPEFKTDVDDVAERGASQYFIEIVADPDTFEGNQGVGLSGTERVYYTNTEDEALSEIYFRLYPNLAGYGGNMQVDTVVMDNQVVDASLEAEGSALRLPLDTPLEPGDSTDITLFFKVTVPVKPEHGYRIFSHTYNTTALANFYPAVALFNKQGWHLEIPPTYGDATFLDISLYQVQLTVPEQLVVAASGSQLESVTNGDGTKTVRLASGPVRDFYIAMRPDYQVVSRKIEGITVNSYYSPPLLEGGRQALEYAVDAMRIFNRRFGPYPYAEFDVAATPTRAGGVEYPGIIVAATSVYRSRGIFFQHVIGHEVAHQWWYGMVGNNQITEPWLDEALTNYSTAIYWEEAEGPQKANDIIENYFFGPYELAKSQGKDMAVIGPVANFTEGEYGPFVYGKGPLFFHMLRLEVGDDIYFEIMQSYFERNKYQTVTATDLFNIIEEISGQNIQPLVETWLQSN